MEIYKQRSTQVQKYRKQKHDYQKYTWTLVGKRITRSKSRDTLSTTLGLEQMYRYKWVGVANKVKREAKISTLALCDGAPQVFAPQLSTKGSAVLQYGLRYRTEGQITKHKHLYIFFLFVSQNQAVNSMAEVGVCVFVTEES